MKQNYFFIFLVSLIFQLNYFYITDAFSCGMNPKDVQSISCDHGAIRNMDQRVREVGYPPSSNCRFQSPAITILPSNGSLSMADPDKAVGNNTSEIYYPDVDTCVTVTVLYDGGLAGVHLFRANQMKDTIASLEQMQALVGKSQVKGILVAGNLSNWRTDSRNNSRTLFDTKNECNLNDMSFQKKLSEIFKFPADDITQEDIHNHFKVSARHGSLTAETVDDGAMDNLLKQKRGD